jgi:hypothetical protein
VFASLKQLGFVLFDQYRSPDSTCQIGQNPKKTQRKPKENACESAAFGL